MSPSRDSVLGSFLRINVVGPAESGTDPVPTPGEGAQELLTLGPGEDWREFGQLETGDLKFEPGVVDPLGTSFVKFPARDPN